MNPSARQIPNVLLSGVTNVGLLFALVLSLAPDSTAQPTIFPQDIVITREQQRAMRGAFKREHTFDRIDADHDGAVEFEEYLDWNWAMHLVFDLDHDDRMSRSEYMASTCPATGPEFENRCVLWNGQDFSSLDSDPRDGKLTKEEFRPHSLRWFRSNDADCPDDRLTRSDFGEEDSSARACRD